MYSWPDGELKQTLDLGDTGLIPLEVDKNLAALGSVLFRLVHVLVLVKPLQAQNSQNNASLTFCR